MYVRNCGIDYNENSGRLVWRVGRSFIFDKNIFIKGLLEKEGLYGFSMIWQITAVHWGFPSLVARVII